MLIYLIYLSDLLILAFERIKLDFEKRGANSDEVSYRMKPLG